MKGIENIQLNNPIELSSAEMKNVLAGRMSASNNCYHLGLDEEKCNGDCEVEINQSRGAITLKGKCQIDSTSEVITACTCVITDPA